MALFQNTVEQKYLKQLDADLINAKYLEFKAYFGNIDIQENIRNSKEEQFQEGFLRELFVKLLGYTLNPEPNFNLTTEYKNIKDSKKADGAIVFDNGACPIVLAVIELKGANTTDLSKIEAQAFGYKNNQPDCVYVITSNFEKLRFYIDNAIEHIEFDLFNLSKADFEILYLCLSYESIKKGIPKKIKDESLSREDIITKKLYQDYSLFKRELHQNLVSLNTQYDSLTLFKKSQKLLDRFLFVFFAEDRYLLPPNFTRMIIRQWQQLKDLDEYIPLYERFKKNFRYLNEGFKGKDFEVYAYNGGLFKPDNILDSLTIDDELLYKHTLKLSERDFASEVDVNILGHIFENSLNELDELTRGLAPLSGEKEKKSLSRRKKDGVFYTPKYITKYIVDNTLGKLCTEKKAELQLNEEALTRGLAPLHRQAPLQKKNKQVLYDKLKTYQKWLLQLTICDPACGSGAFLNQALDFLIAEHRFIDELQAKLLGVPIIFSDIEKSILENNLFGVDLNEESVEIAKLSLWLRTAQPNRKLNDLNNNIKCGNSLIDDPAVAGDKAFNWHEEFPQVFRLKKKKGWHITCATHNSRYSQRMFDYHVEVGEAVWLSEKEELIIIATIARIAKEDNLNIVACNVCGDHLHLLLVCEEQEVPKIVGKLKSISARECNIAMGRTIPAGAVTREHAPLSSSRGAAQAHLWTQKFGCKEITSQEQLDNTINYIRNNRVKHGLPALGGGGSRGTCPLATAEYAFRPEYTGGFDVVIGNPPYVNIVNITDEIYRKRLQKDFKTFKNKCDLYSIFIEKGISLCKYGGELGFIFPNSWMGTSSFSVFREYILKKTKINSFVELPPGVFSDATVTTVIMVLTKIYPEIEHEIRLLYCDNQIFYNKPFTIKLSDILSTPHYSFSFDNKTTIKSGDKKLGDIVSFSLGIKTSDDSRFIFREKKDKDYYPMLRGKNIGRYYIEFGGDYLWYKPELITQKPGGRPRILEHFLKPKIVIQDIAKSINASIDFSNSLVNDTINVIHEINDGKPIQYILGLLNSKLINRWFSTTFPEGLHIKINQLQEIPLPNDSINIQNEIVVKVNQMLSFNKEFQETSQKFQRNIQREYNLEKLSSKLENWFQLPFKEFLKELEKSKVKITLSRKAEWEDYFLQEQEKALAIKHRIDTTDNEIDRLVYQLYGLTDEEIKIVET